MNAELCPEMVVEHRAGGMGASCSLAGVMS
jgi:hypothetical protein